MKTVTRDHRIRVALAGACRLPPLGAKIETLSQSDLLWAENILTEKEKSELKQPLWTKSGNGDGNGNGNGYGYGNGYGDGDGYGYGNGYGNGNGYGYGLDGKKLQESLS